MNSANQYSQEDIRILIIMGIVVGVIVLIQWLAIIISCPVIASRKNRSAFGWFWGGIFLGLTGLIIIGSLPKIEQKD